MRKRRVDGLHRGGRSRSAASKQRPRRARLAGPATSSNGVSPQTQLREPPVLSVHCCAGYATIYTVASGHKEATINARRAEMLYMAACRVLRDRAAAPSQSVWASSAAQIRSMAQIGLACSEWTTVERAAGFDEAEYCASGTVAAVTAALGLPLRRVWVVNEEGPSRPSGSVTRVIST